MVGRRRGTPLIVGGVVLLLMSVTTAAYSRFTEWQHEVQVHASAPPAEALPERLERSNSSTPSP